MKPSSLVVVSSLAVALASSQPGCSRSGDTQTQTQAAPGSGTPGAGTATAALTTPATATATPPTTTATLPAPAPVALLMPEDPKRTLREGFFVYGFSRDAKLAFVETKVEDGKGETTWRLVIHDLRDDVLVEDLQWATPAVIDATTLTPFTDAKGPEITALLAKHRIEASGELLPAAFTHKDSTLRVVVSGSDEMPVDGDRPRSVVLVKQPGDLEKKIGAVLEKGIAGMPVLYGSAPLAVLRSPFEARAAVFVVTTVRGFEGPPNGRRVTVLGADLERGFAR